MVVGHVDNVAAGIDTSRKSGLFDLSVVGVTVPFSGARGLRGMGGLG